MQLIDWLVKRSHRKGDGLIVYDSGSITTTAYCNSETHWHNVCRGMTYANNLWTKPTRFTPHP